MENKYLKRRSTLLFIMKMQIKTIIPVKHYFTPIRVLEGD